MRRLNLSLPELMFVAATRGALGAGVGLLLAGKIRRDRRRVIGLSLTAFGVLTTIPAAIAIFRRGASSTPKVQPSAA